MPRWSRVAQARLSGGSTTFSAAKFTGPQFARRRCAAARNRALSFAAKSILRQRLKLADVIRARKRPRAERMRIGHGDFIRESRARRRKVISTRPPKAFSRGSVA